MNVVAGQVGQQYPEMKEWGIQLVDFYHCFVNPQLQTALVVLLCAVGCVLLIACGERRQPAAGARGVAAEGNRRAHRDRREPRPAAAAAAGREPGAVVDRRRGRTAGGALGRRRDQRGDARRTCCRCRTSASTRPCCCSRSALTIATGLLFGIAPAWHAAKTDLNEVLKQATRASSGARPRLRNGLAAAELALATILLIGAGLLTQSLLRLQHVSLGFQPDRLLTFQIALPRTKYPLDKSTGVLPQRCWSRCARRRASAPPASSSGIPFGDGNYTTTPIATTGPSPLPPDTAIPTDWRIVTPGFFQAMSIPLLRGRDFADADAPAAAPLVVIVSQTTAKRFWGDADPLGRTLHRQGDLREAVHRRRRRRRRAADGAEPGVAGDLLPEHRPDRSMGIVVRTDPPPTSLLPTVRQKVHDLDPALPMSTVRTMDEWVSNNAAQPRLNAILLGGVRGGRDADCGDRHLRRARLLGEPADAGDRPAHGARRAARAGAAADRARRDDGRRDRHRRRARRRARAQPRAGEPGLRRAGPRSADLRRRRGGAGARRAGRLRDPGAEGVARRSDGRAAKPE